MMVPNQVFKGWQFSFREVFRMIVPGVGILVLGSPLISQFLWILPFMERLKVKFVDSTIVLLSTLLVGLIWFSLQIPKRMSLYRDRVALIRSLIFSLSGKKDFVDKSPYQYLVDCVIHPSASIRIHYFASYYYMMMDLALITYLLLLVNIAAMFAHLAMPIPNSKLLLNVTMNVLLYQPERLLSLLGLFIIWIACWKSAVYFLDDVMQFSIFVVEKHKKQVRALARIACESKALQTYVSMFR